MRSFTSPAAAAAALSLAVRYAQAATQQVCPTTNVCFSVGVPTSSASSNSGNIYFQISAPTTYSWVALGTGTGMSGSNIFVIYQDGSGNVTVSPRLGTGHTMPTLDTSSTAAKLTLLAGSGVSGDTMTANVMCSNCESWNSGSGSMSLISTSSNWISAWKSGSALNSASQSASISEHDSTKRFTIDLTSATITDDSNPFVSTSTDSSGGSNSSSGSGSSSGSNSGSGVTVVEGDLIDKAILNAHGIIMAIVMVVLYPLGSMLMPTFGNWKLHAGFQLLAFVLMWVGFGLGVKAAQERDELYTNTHTTFGTVIPALMVLQPIGGYIHHLQFLKTGGRTAVSHAHIWYGRILIILGIINGGLGLQLAGADNSLNIAYGVVAGIIFTGYIGSAIFGEIRRSRRNAAATGAGNRHLNKEPSSPTAHGRGGNQMI